MVVTDADPAGSEPRNLLSRAVESVTDEDRRTFCLLHHFRWEIYHHLPSEGRWRWETELQFLAHAPKLSALHSGATPRPFEWELLQF